MAGADFLGSFDGLDYFSSPIATQPSSGARYLGIRRGIDCFGGRSTLVAQFGRPGVTPSGEPWTHYTDFGMAGLQASDHADAQRALQELRDAEAAVRADPRVLGSFPSASGRELNPDACPARTFRLPLAP